MSNPIVAAPPANPIGFDPGIAYEYVVPCTGETAIAFTPAPGFSILIAGRAAAITFVNPAPAADQTYVLHFIISNGEGATSHDVTVKVRGNIVKSVDPSFKAAVVNGSKDLRFGVATAAAATPLPINARLRVGMKLKAVTRVSGTAVTDIDASSVYVVRVDDSLGRFRVSATSGGAEITPDHDATYMLETAVAVDTTPNIFIGDTSDVLAGDPVVLTYTNGVAMPSNFAGAKFVKAIVDSQFITIADTLGGATVNADADSFPDDENVRLLVDLGGSRRFPNIDSGSEIAATPGNAIDAYAFTTDIAADAKAVQNLPPGLSFDGTNITGTPNYPLAFQTAIRLIAYRGSSASYRYLLVNSTLGDVPDLNPDALYDINTKRFYLPSGPAGRADRLELVEGDPPFVFAFEQNGADFVMPAGATVRFRAKQKYSDSSALVLASVTLTSALQKFSIGEDWSAAGLAALLADETKHVDLICWLEWKLAGETNYRRSYPTPLRVYRSDGSALATTAPNFFVQSKPFSALTGGGAAALDSVVTSGLALNTWMATAVIDQGGGLLVESRWLLIAGTDSEDAPGGVVRPDDYDGSTNAKVWVRVSGL